MFPPGRCESERSMKIDKILVPTDFSACSAVAIEYARDLAEMFSAEILVVHVTEIPFEYTGYGLSADTILAIQEDLKGAIDQKLGEVGKQFGDDARTSLYVREGSAFYEIVEMAKEREADLIVLGTHGHTGLKHLWLGSTAERVVRAAPCPVLTVRDREREFVRGEAAGTPPAGG